MGTWSAKHFGNDAARDWLFELEKATDPSFPESTLESVLAEDAEEDASEECRALAAAALIASAAEAKPSGVPQEAKAWIRSLGYVPQVPTLEAALTTVNKISERSELRALWEEAGSLDKWMAEIGKLREKLVRAIASPLPERKAVKARPRSLHKLAALPGVADDDKARAKIRTLLEKLPNLNERSKETGWDFPLCLMAEAGLAEEVEWLLEHGADPLAPRRIGFTSPLILACKRGHRGVVDQLMRAGVPIVYEWYLDQRTDDWRDVAPSPEEAAHYPSQPVSPALFAAVRFATPEFVDYLLGLGASLSLTDLNGEGLLHLAAESGNLPVVRHLLSLGFDPNTTTYHMSPLKLAKICGFGEVVRALLEAGADPTVDE